MTEDTLKIPLYWSAPYHSSVISVIISVRDDEVQLDQTIFYPGGGGQPADKGVLLFEDQEYEIIDVHKEDNIIWHKIRTEGALNLEPQQQVLLKLDWKHRYSLMKAHTAQHLFSHYLQEMYDCTTLKANFEPYVIDIEVEKKLTSEQVIEVLKEVNKRMIKGGAIESIIVDQNTYSEQYKKRTRGKISKEETVRLIEIMEVGDLVCCGGTHVKNLKEIHGVFLSELKNGKIKLVVDQEGINYANEQRALMMKLEALTTKKGEKLAELVENKLQENQRLVHAVSEALGLALRSIEPLTKEINGHKVAFLHLPNIDRDLIRPVTGDLPDNIFIVILGKNDILYLLSTSQNLQASDVAKIIREEYDQKGGGNKGFAQIKLEGIENPLDLVEKIIQKM
ncbi:MAG: alanine--tRNA ligase-related protein [Candidatus Heimdallarchaeaceae archaeon]